MEMTGAQWKELMRKVMPIAKPQGDRSEFKNARIGKAGATVRVRADCYSVRKCYWDRSY